MRSKCRKSWEWGAMRRVVLTTFFAVCLVVILLPNFALAEDHPTSGTCGENVTWEFEPEVDSAGNWVGGTLTISGTGPMENYTYVVGGNSWNDSFSSIVEKIVIEDGVTSIGTWAFSDCDKLTSVVFPDSLSHIGDYAFSGTSLISVSIPAKVIRMERAFYYCSTLTEINVDTNNLQYSSENGTLYDKEKTTLLLCPRGKKSYVIPNGITTIGNSAFKSCSKLTDIFIPDSVTRIESSAFSFCTKLTTVTIPGSVTYVGPYAFSSCSDLINISIPASLKDLSHSYDLFSDCTGITSVTISDGVERIASGMFSGCTHLENIYLPVSLSWIDFNAFKDCSSLKTINYNGSETQWGKIGIAEGNQELNLATLVFNSTSSNPVTPPGEPVTPVTPSTPGTLSLSVSNGGLGRKVTVQVDGGHWLTVQTRRAGSVSLTSVQAPGSGKVTLAFSAAAGSSIQAWETAEEMTFSSQGVPNNTILATASRTL